MSAFDTLKQQIVEAAQELVQKGYLMATGGNLSLRLPGQDGFAITPSNYDYLKMTPDDVCILDFDLNLLEGELKPSVESAMHSVVYQVRGDVNAIVHTHQVYASALTLIKAPIPALFDEQARFLGRTVDIIPYAPSGTGFLKNTVARHVKNHNNAFMMQNHGALVFGHDIERAIHNVEILEKCALAYLLAICSERKISKIPVGGARNRICKITKRSKEGRKGRNRERGRMKWTSRNIPSVNIMT
ncbi:MAG: class II aldolase/adducin family protein [Chloroflexi bacterium]|nr:class II aldolase/adducin family protein [Chloroflexota bacterium]